MNWNWELFYQELVSPENIVSAITFWIKAWIFLIGFWAWNGFPKGWWSAIGNILTDFKNIPKPNSKPQPPTE